MGRTTSPEVVALMLADARLPTGGHTQSAGLEPAVRAGLGAEGKQLADVVTYARDRVRTVTRVEAAVAVVSRHLCLSASHQDPRAATTGGSPLPGWHQETARQLDTVEKAWAARTPSDVLRGVSRRQGRAYLRLAARVWPQILAYLPADSEVPRPIVVGVIGAVTGMSAEQVARVVAYDDVQTVVAASLKLLPVDPADAAAWVADLHDDIERLVTDVAPLTEIEKIPAHGAPLIDLFAQNHSIERMRLFHA
ncbi:urease accessory UreF family protein [Kribbella sp. NPDC051952]|uniref:urease accessory protein UreF n=1 Tax=Kribbella sp. NPDC051952 TaxID=3154851 RepID=UPI00342E36E2